MPKQQPYQPLFFRLSHALNAFLALGAFITGFLVYDSYDRRFGGLALTQNNRELIDIHGTFGFFLFYIFIAFAIYSLTAGKKRLIQPNTLKNLTQTHKPGWWYTLLRITNTIALIAAALSVISGKFQDENWLPQGNLNEVWYYIHLIAWVMIGLAIALHILMAIKVGGTPLIISMFNTQYKPEDHPKLWIRNIKNRLRL